MTEHESHPTPDAEPRPELARDLKNLFEVEAPVPPEVDEAVVHAARAHLLRRRTRPWFRLGVSGAAAAALLLMVWWNQQPPPPAIKLASPRSSAPGVATGEDIDGSGRVDILDALTLKRLIESGNALAHHDVDGDGAVNDQDVDRVAHTAVRLR